MHRSTLPLAGIRVIDFTQVMMGPVATQMLGDYGADVIKIERPPTGDLSRTSIPDDPAGLVDPVFCSLNRNKRSVALDLRKRRRAGDRHATWSARADVVVNNFRAGVMERMGFGYEELQQDQPAPDLRGRHRLRPDRSLRAQGRAGRARAGDVRRDGAPLRREPCRSSVYADDLRRLLGRHAPGAGRPARAAAAGEDRRAASRSRVSLLDSMLAVQTQEAATQLMRERELNWGAMPLSGVFETTDGALVMVGAFKANPLKDICRALEPAGPRRPIRASPPSPRRSRTSRRCRRLFRERFTTNTTAHWIGTARGAGPALRAGAHAGRGARRRADGDQRHDRGGARRGRDRAAGRLADPPWTRRRSAAHRAAGARRAHRGGAGRARLRADRIAELRKGEVLHADPLRRQGSRRARHHRPAGRAERHRRGVRSASCRRIWDGDRAQSRRALRRADRHRRARLLHRRRHEGGSGATGLEYWAAPRPGGFGGIALRETLDVPVIARVNGHALGGGIRDGARLRHRRRGRERDASACPSRASAACRSTAA